MTQRERYGNDIWQLRQQDVPYDEIADRLGIPASSARRIWQQERDEREGAPPPEMDDDEPPEGNAESFEFRVEGMGATATAQGKSIKTLEQLLDTITDQGGDLDPWRVSRHIVNVWEMGRKNKVVDLKWDSGLATGYVKDDGGWTNKANWQVKAWFEPRLEYPLEMAVERIVNTLSAHAPTYDPPPPLYGDGAYLSVWNLYDAHFGKRSTDGGYTLAKAQRDFMAAGNALSRRVQSLDMPIERIILPVAQDALHADNLQGTTTKGTWVDTAADIRDAIDALCIAVVHVIESAANIAPVDVIAVPSNHDRLSAFWLGKFLQAWFRTDERVTVDTLKDPRKYYQWGRVLLGFDHGDKVRPDKLALLMATEAPAEWAKTAYREFLRGHFHRAQRMYFPATEESGVNVRVIPALCPPDDYHLLHGYIGGHRAAEGIFYHREYGPAGTFPVFVDEL